MIIMKSGDIVLNILEDCYENYCLLEKWYKIKDVYKNFEQRQLSFKEIKEKYKIRTSEDAEIPVYMIKYKNIPVGIIQYKLIDIEDKKLYKLSEDKIYEVDIFIGETKFHNLGIGSKSINLLSNYLFNKKKADKIIMCPLSDNCKAINCYKKCGFIENKKFKTKDTIGDLKEYILMEKKR